MLPDNDFDDLFRKRVDEFETGFDESAWGDMEHRLRKRDRIVWAKRSSMLLLLLFLLGAGGYYLTKKPVTAEKNFTKTKQGRVQKGGKSVPETIPEKSARPVFAGKNPSLEPAGFSTKKPVYRNNQAIAAVKKNSGKIRSFETVTPEQKTESQNEERPVNNMPANTAKMQNPIVETLASNEKKTGIKTASATKKIAVKTARPVIWSLTFSAGPDVSSVQKLGGSFPKLQVGFLVNAEVRKNLTLSTGLRYGVKKYSATPFDYALSARGQQLQITGIDASCNVLELPMRVSYTLAGKKLSDLKINAGLSSYFMLKEDYGFEYAPQTGRPEFYFSKNNANQHVLSVAEISATYSIRPKNSPVSFGIEPYLKLPLAGVGEGRVKLNSTGVSLNVTYGFSKK